MSVGCCGGSSFVGCGDQYGLLLMSRRVNGHLYVVPPGCRCPFIEDNLLFYTVLFQELLPRLHRMDFTSPQSAYMLFRVTKVTDAFPTLCVRACNFKEGKVGFPIFLDGRCIGTQNYENDL